jgi:hypothetical protein
MMYAKIEKQQNHTFNRFSLPLVCSVAHRDRSYQKKIAASQKDKNPLQIKKIKDTLFSRCAFASWTRSKAEGRKQGLLMPLRLG